MHQSRAGGRPPLDGENAAVHVTCRVPRDTVTALRIKATRQGRPAADLIREALDRYVAEAAS